MNHVTNLLIDNVESIKLTKGEQQRDFVYITDAVNALMCIVDSVDTLQLNEYFFEVGTDLNLSLCIT